MTLTNEQKKKLEEALLNKWFERGPNCPFCQGTEWEVNNTIYAIPDFESFQRKRVVPNQVYPVIIIICTTCGNSVMFSATKLGLI